MALLQDPRYPDGLLQRKKKSPYSMDANLLHISYEGGVLESPGRKRKRICGAGASAPRPHPMPPPTYIELDFERGDIVAIDGAPP